MQELIIFKLGGSVITDKSKPLTARNENIARFAKEISVFLKKYKGKLIITHGSGSFGHFFASKYRTAEGLINKESIKGLVLTSDIAVKINRIVMMHFVSANLAVKSFSPTSLIYAKEGKLKSVNCEPIKKALDLGLTPVLYGDVVMDEKKGFCIYSAEKVIEVLVGSLNKDFLISKIIHFTDTNGVYDDQGRTIKKITPENFSKIKGEIRGSKSTDVTGGMLHKVEESLKLVKRYKLNVFLCNGNKKSVISNRLWERKENVTEISFE